MDSDRRSRRGIIFILSAPSGAGKTTISRAALNAIEGLEPSVSLTTRGPRENEADGLDYHFVSEEEFNRRLAGDELAESAGLRRQLRHPARPARKRGRRRPRHPPRYRYSG